jgi:hypothetical protein
MKKPTLSIHEHAEDVIEYRSETQSNASLVPYLVLIGITVVLFRTDVSDTDWLTFFLLHKFAYLLRVPRFHTVIVMILRILELG